jgi:glycosyltransferase involved in cell wall biosynthesis
LKVLLIDYSGHPFQAQLARGLAARDNDVLHVHCPSFVTGKGRVERAPDDPPRLEFAEVPITGEFAKYNVRRRLAHELESARALGDSLERFAPDVVVASNVPLVAQARLQRWCRRNGIGYLLWQQDIYSAAARRVVGRHGRVLGSVAAVAVGTLERRLLRRSDAVVVISEDFLPQLRRWRIDEARVEVIENWAPLPELPVLPRENPWRSEQDLGDQPVFLYSGTLGFKHDPSLLLELARFARGRDALVVVVSEGPGADWLATHGGDEPALRLLPYQPYERLPEVHASADVLVALLEPEAGAFSVPSKVLSYLCAERPILLSVPEDNLAARIVERSGGGVVVPPRDKRAFVAAAGELLADGDRRAELGRAARNYAEFAFDLEAISDRFERLLERAASAA